MKAKTILSANVPLSEIKGHMCAWKGCTSICHFEGFNLPRGWRWLAIWWGKEPQPFGNGNYVDRDAVLCPQHFAELHDRLLKDIGQRLNETKGTA